MYGSEKTERGDDGSQDIIDWYCCGYRTAGNHGTYCFLIIAVVAGVGAYFVNLNANLEYEYLYVDKQLTVDKIMARTRRKKVEPRYGKNGDSGPHQIMASG